MPGAGVRTLSTKWGFFLLLVTTSCLRPPVDEDPPPPPPLGAGLGGACESSADCADGLGCHKGFPGGYCTEQCVTTCPGGACQLLEDQRWCLAACLEDTECRDGYACRQGVCQLPCTSNRQCRSGKLCQDGRCVDDGIGAACTDDSACAEGLSCGAKPGGYCTRTCDGTVPCPTGTDCFTTGGQGFCLNLCEGADECRDGYVCQAGLCDVACTGDADCPSGQACRDQLCVETGLGEACAGAADCAAGLTCWQTVPGGFCTVDCTSGADCPQGATCGDLLGRRQCLARCAADSDCGAGRVCAGGGCTAPCTSDGMCPAGMSCEAPGRCRLPDVVGTLETESLGMFAPGAIIEIPVAFDDISLMVLARTQDAEAVIFDRVETPGGVNLVGADPLDGPLRVGALYTIGVVQVPNGDLPEIQLVPGNWRFSFYTWGGSFAEVLVLRKKGNPAAGGSLAVRFHLAEGVLPGVTAANAATHPHLSGMVERAELLLGGAGVSLGTPEWVDLDARYLDIETSGAFSLMLRDNADDGYLNVFVVRSLSSSDGVKAGLAAGIPGPPQIGGTRSSGVAVTLQQTTRLSGDTLAHEMGHFLGLWHISELDGQSHDLLTDTPECASLSTCAGRYHLMFPYLTGVMDTVSDASAQVIRLNPQVR